MNVGVSVQNLTLTNQPHTYLEDTTPPNQRITMSESQLQKLIMLECGKRGWLCFHTNVGRVQTIDGRYFDTGLPKGWPDLLIITNTGQSLFVELKVHPNKPKKHQISMINLLRKSNCYCFVTFSLLDFYNKLSQCDFYVNENNKK